MAHSSRTKENGRLYLIIIQARMGSTRLPGKSLLKLAGKPVIQRVYERASRAEGADEVVVAIPTGTQDDILARFCHSVGIPVYRGSEEDVLDRYYQAAKLYSADAIVRITGDCPLIDPHEVTRVISEFGESEFDYLSNSQPQRYPLGLNVSIGSFASFEKSWHEATLQSEREHVTLYIRTHPKKFKIGSIVYEQNFSHYNWSLDEPKDYAFLSTIYEKLGEKNLYGSFGDVLLILAENPELVKLGLR